MNGGELVLFIGVAATLMILVLAARSGGASRRALSRRAEAINRRAHGLKPAVDAARLTVRRVETDGPFPTLDRALKGLLPRASALRDRLDRTGRNISIGSYIVTNVVLFVVAFGLLAGLGGLPPAIALPLALVAGIGLPNWVVGKMAKRRIGRFNALFPDSIDLIVRGLRSGLPVTESIGAVGREMADPVGVEFRKVFDTMRFGRTLEDALWDAARRLNTPEFKFFVISLSVQKETGGNLAETLANLSDILRKRRQMKLKIKAMSSEARASAVILGSLPFIMFGIISALNWSYESTLFTDPRGLVLVGVGLSSLLLGVLVMAKMVSFEI